MKYIIFDLDGTLVNSVPDITLVANHVLQYVGLASVNTEVVKSTIGYGIEHTIKALLPSDASQNIVEQAVQQGLSFYNEYPVCESTLFDGVLDMLHTLQSKQVQLSILSNKNQSLVDKVVQYFFSHIHWTSVIGIDLAAYKKPNPYYRDKIFNTASSQEVLSTYMVGDNNADALFAKNANIGFIGAGWGHYSVDINISKFSNFFVASNPSDLLSYIYI